MSELERPSSISAMNPGWSSEWLRGFLPFFVLNILSAGPSYGYAISADLAQSGIGDVRGGTLYPLLTRLEAAGFVSTTWKPGTGGPGRKYFNVTPAGTDEFHRLRHDWRAFVTVTEKFLTNQGKGTQNDV